YHQILAAVAAAVAAIEAYNQHLENAVFAGVSSGVLWILGITSLIDPPLAPILTGVDLLPAAPKSEGRAETSQFHAGEAGTIVGSTQLSSLAIVKRCLASWQAGGTECFQTAALRADVESVVDAHGRALGSGRVAFSNRSAVPLLITGRAAYAVSGTGNLSLYAQAEQHTLGVSGNWADY